MYLKRKIDQYLIEWKSDPEHLPLIVKGARQVGKTESIMNFATKNYENIVYINFALEKKYKTILDSGYDVESIINNITLIDTRKSFIPENTIIIFDEIQEYPDIATTLKSFKIDGKYDVVCSGSMLGINYNQIHSNSVGYKTDYEMYSMDFEEFLWAKGYDSKRVDSIFNNMIEMKPFSSTEMEVYNNLFLSYCVLGGMPAVVRNYIDKGNYSGSIEIQKQIMMDYEEDVRKYAIGLEQTKIMKVYRSIPLQLAKENKKFQYNKVDKNARAREYLGCIDWLKDAGTINVCYSMNFPELPIKGNLDESKFKIYYPDTGLLISCLDDETQEDLRANKNLGVYKGALYENFAAESFVKQGIALCYYSKENSQLEEDFLVRTTNELLPVEVKSNKKSSISLKTLVESERYKDIQHGIKFSQNNIGYVNNIYTFPYFCLFLLKKFLKEGIIENMK